MSKEIIAPSHKREIIETFFTHGLYQFFSGKLELHDHPIQSATSKMQYGLQIGEAVTLENNVIFPIEVGSKTPLKWSTLEITSMVSIENNFYGNLILVELTFMNSQHKHMHFHCTEEIIKCLERDRLVIQIINKGFEPNYQSFKCGKNISPSKDREKYSPEKLRPVVIPNLKLFSMQLHQTYKDLGNRTAAYVGVDHHKWLSLTWINNLSEHLIWLGNKHINLQDKYQTLSENIASLKSIKDLHSKLSTENEMDSPITSSDYLALESTIELIECWMEDPDKIMPKVMSKEWISKFKSYYINRNLVESDFLDTPFSELDYKIWFELPDYTAEHFLYYLLPEITDYGKRYASLSLIKKDINYTEIKSKTGLRDASRFWDRYFPDNDLIEMNTGIGEFELPCEIDELELFLSMFKEDLINDKKLQQYTSSIATEIEQDGSYLLHPDVTFDLRNEIFSTVTINRSAEVANDYHCVFRNNNNEYFKIIFSMTLGAARVSSHSLTDELFKHHSNQLALYCIKLIRDFMVPIEREKIFSFKPRKQSFGKATYDHSLKIIYVPRVRYKYTEEIVDYEKTYEQNFPFRPKLKHSVRPHFRQLTEGKKPSNSAILLARKYNCSIPEGFTFVKDHERGGLNEEQKVIYRSRSILQTFYGAKEGNIKKNDWFEFEKDIEKLLSKSCKEVIRRQASHDGGIDIEAIDHDGNVLLAQCKCYAPKRKIDRKYVDELYGSITRFKNENELEHVHGIIFTTSSFSKDAIDAAQALEIELVSGLDLQKLMSDEGM